MPRAKKTPGQYLILSLIALPVVVFLAFIAYYLLKGL